MFRGISQDINPLAGVFSDRFVDSLNTISRKNLVVDCLLKLLTSIGLTTEQMICCGDGYNDLTMIETAGLGVAMANAQPAVRETADYITKSNDEDGVLHVINEFMR